uniref:Uncharacterized protein n=1 Tax=Moniliophthora roreri TaxID=221103 RepID=A0A0W0GDK1_MONRR
MQQGSRASTSRPNSPQLSLISQRPQPTPSDDSTEQAPHVQLTVWDDEEEEDVDEEDDRDLHPVRTFNDPTMWPMARTEEVYMQLNALFARWEPTVPSTVKTTVVRFVDNLQLVLHYLRSNVQFNSFDEVASSLKQLHKFKLEFVQWLLKFRGPDIGVDTSIN